MVFKYINKEMTELVVVVIIIVFSIAIYYLMKVSTKEISFEKILEEQKQNQISIIDILPQKHKKPKKRKKKTDDCAVKKEIFVNIPTVVEDKVASKSFSNKENEKTTENRVGKKKNLEITSKVSEEIKSVKENPSHKEISSVSKCNQDNFVIAKNISLKPKKVEKFQQNNSTKNACSSTYNKSLEKQEINKSPKSSISKHIKNIDEAEKPEHNLPKPKQSKHSYSIEKHENNKSLKSKNSSTSVCVPSCFPKSNSLKEKCLKERNNKMQEKIVENIDNNIQRFEKSEKHENNKSLKSKNSSTSVCVPSSFPKSNSPKEKCLKERNNKMQEKIVENIDSNIQRIEKSFDAAEQASEVNKLSSSSVKNMKQKVGHALSSSGELSYSKLKQFIQKSQLAGSESQILIELLLNKQVSGNTGGEWIEKGKVINPTSQLQRQLEECQSKLDKECETNKALLAKISILRNDLNSERSRARSFQEELKSSNALLQHKMNEISAAHKEQMFVHTNEIRESMNQEFKTKLEEKEKQLKAENEITLQKYKSNVSDLETQFQQLQTAHQSSEINCEKIRNVLSETQHQLNNLNQERDELLQTCQTYQQHLSNIKEQTSEHEMRLNTRLFEVQQKLKTCETSELQLISKMNHLSEEKERLEQQVKNYENTRDIFSQNQIKLENIAKENCDLESQVQAYKNDIFNLHELISIKELEIHRLAEENDEISERFRPVNNTIENGLYCNSFSSQEKICFCGKQNLPLEEGKDSTLNVTPNSIENELKTSSKKKETSIENKEKIKIVEKIIEKIIQDPSTLEQLEETKKENGDMKIKIDSLTEEKRLLEENLKITTKVDQSKLVQDLQIENKTLAEKVNNYQRILSNTETLLKTLQKSVENEEHAWRGKLLQNEEALKQLSMEKDELVLQVQGLRRLLQTDNDSKIETELNLVKEKLHLETKAKNKLADELITVQEQLKSVTSCQCDENGTADEVHQNEDSDSISSSQEQVPLQAEKKKKKNGRLSAAE